MTTTQRPVDLVSWSALSGQFLNSDPFASYTEAPSLEQRARATDPDTSKAAGAVLDPTRLEREVLEVIKSFGDAGCISDQVEAALSHIKGSSLTPRYAGLSKKGLIEDCGDRRVALSGRKQIVWVATW